MATIDAAVEVNAPLHDTYLWMSRFEQFPRFMEGVREVRRVDDTHLHWHAVSDGRDREWDAVITEQVPEMRIAWRNISGHLHSGRVEFHAIDETTTRITMFIEFDDDRPGEGQGLADLLTARSLQDLARFKKLIEAEMRNAGAMRPAAGRDGAGARPQRRP